MEKQKFSARVKQAMGEASITNLYQLNGMVPVHKAIPFGSTNRSSPTNWQRLPMRSVSFFQPSQSFSFIPSSIESIGNLLISSSR